MKLQCKVCGAGSTYLKSKKCLVRISVTRMTTKKIIDTVLYTRLTSLLQKLVSHYTLTGKLSTLSSITMTVAKTWELWP